MLFLKVTSLLENYGFSIETVSDLVTNSPDAVTFDEKVLSIITDDEATFKNSWIKCGYNIQRSELIERLIQNHYRKTIITVVAQASRKTHDVVESNDSVVSEIISQLVEQMKLSDLAYGQNLSESIRKDASEKFKNNKPKYIERLSSRPNDYTVNPAYDEESIETYSMVDNWELALSQSRIPTAEVRLIMHDLVSTFNDVKLTPNDIDQVTLDYTLYESYLRTMFKEEISEFNNKFKGLLEVKMPDHASASKYTKYDDLMERLYKTFINKGINKDNFDQMINLITRIVATEEGFTVTNVAQFFGFKKTENGEPGRFNTKTRLASDSAVQKYDRLMLGLVALSRLVIAIKKAGRSPYEINPLIFTDRIPDTESKFISIAQLLKYSNLMLEVVEEYGLNQPVSKFSAIVSAGGGSLLTTGKNPYADIIAKRSQHTTIQSFASTILGTTVKQGSNPEVLSIFSFYEYEWSVNIFHLVSALHMDINPLAVIYRYESPPEENEFLVDEDFIFDPFVVLKRYNLMDFPYIDYDLPLSKFNDFTDELLKGVPYIESTIPSERLRSTKMEISNFAYLLDDLRQGDIKKNVKILYSLYKFIEDCNKFVEDYHKSNLDGVLTFVDFATAVYSSDIFKPLHDNIEFEKMRDAEGAYKCMELIIKKYSPDITMSDINDFLNQKVRTQMFSTFKRSTVERTFLNVYTHFVSAKAGLYSLTEEGRSVRLTGSELEAAINHATPTAEYIDIFESRFANIARDQFGYLVNAQGQLFHLIDYNNLVGALHSNGYYIFTDGTTRAWNWSVMNGLT